jgi:thiamine-phosphate pyrophosphorylase
MALKLPSPLLYLITSGRTTAQTTPASKDFSEILDLIDAAVSARINLVQIREKNLNARVLFELATRGAQIVRSSDTRLLVNDRADIAYSAGAHGVHLTTTSIEPAVVRETFGDDFLIGVSTHSTAEAVRARDGGSDFAVFGPVFPTASKQSYGDPVGLEALRKCTSTLAPFPILALGGVATENIRDCFRAGAAGVAAIRLFADAAKLATVSALVRSAFDEFLNDG